MSTTSPVEEILAFWFGPDGRARWFDPDPSFDAACGLRFGPLVDEAASDRLRGWAADPQGSLALCLLLDQFPRNIWRGTPRAFAYDARARRVANDTIASGLDRRLQPEERLFVYLPFEHSESLVDQERAVALMGELGDAEWLDYAVRHRDIIARFGRFPHRNAILGRASTPEELAFLQQPGSSF